MNRGLRWKWLWDDHPKGEPELVAYSDKQVHYSNNIWTNTLEHKYWGKINLKV